MGYVFIATYLYLSLIRVEKLEVICTLLHSTGLVIQELGEITDGKNLTVIL